MGETGWVSDENEHMSGSSKSAKNTKNKWFNDLTLQVIFH
jgi:hypothetical protein